jgi:protein-S-isoprenylcysteine O-methyltransferase Ste14
MYGSQGSWMRESGILQMPFVEVLATIYFLLYTAGTSAIFYRIPLEDKMLQHAFGEEWESWVKSVKYRLLPGVY